MRKVLFTLLAFIYTISSSAQYNDSIQNEPIENCIDSIIKRLDILEHNYYFLECNYKLCNVNKDTKIVINEINIQSNSILINCYQNNYSELLYKSYLRKYESYIKWYESQKKLMSSVKTFVQLRIITSNFSDSELELLNSSIDSMDESVNVVEASLEYYKIVLAMYKDISK